MKKSISLVLCLAMLVSVFSCLGVTASAVDVKEMFTVESALNDDKLTYIVYLKENVNLSAAIIFAEYNASVLSIDEENTGAYMVTDSYGDESENVGGFYEIGKMTDFDNRYSIAHVASDPTKDYNSGKTRKGYMVFTFDVIDTTNSGMAVSFYCKEYNSNSVPENNIFGHEDPHEIATITTTYMETPDVISLTNGDRRIFFDWSAVEGATAYRVYRRTIFNDGAVSEWQDLSGKIPEITYTDATVAEGVNYEYAIRAYSADSNSPLSSTANLIHVSTGHSYGDWLVTTEPTCEEEGVLSSTCATCGDVLTQPIEALGHDYEEGWTLDKEATCTEDGSESRHCSRCDAKTDVNVLPATGHEEGSWETVREATCSKVGKKQKECTVCGDVLETKDIPMKAHKSGSWKTEKKATVNSAGKKVKKCTVCGKTLDTAKIAQLKCSKPTIKELTNTADGVKITWGKVSGADKYYVYRKTGSGKYSKIATTTRTYYTDQKASSGKKYYYYVKAVNEAGSSDSSSSKSITYLADTTLKTPSSTKKGIVLKWSKVTGADGYMVYRKTGSGSYSKIATVKGSTKVTYTDKKAKKGKTYTYKVKAYKSKTYSAFSNAKKIKDKY